jgi:hypothetical protein
VADKAIAALGFAPHSGWAAVIAAEESHGCLRVLVRERVEMVDPHEPSSKQPYHAAEDLPLTEAKALLARYAATAERKAGQAIERIVGELSRGGRRVSGIGILESAGRKGAALANILASHALIHTADGDHFRDAIAGAAARCGLTAARVAARELDARAATATGKPIETLRATLKNVGRALGPPWTADQKAAALLAWTILAEAPPDHGGARSRP